MNRRNLFKSLLALPLISCVGQGTKDKRWVPQDYISGETYDFSEIDLPKPKRGPYNTDDVYYDQWLEEYGKDEMHLDEY